MTALSKRSVCLGAVYYTQAGLALRVTLSAISYQRLHASSDYHCSCILYSHIQCPLFVFLIGSVHCFNFCKEDTLNSSNATHLVTERIVKIHYPALEPSPNQTLLLLNTVIHHSEIHHHQFNTRNSWFLTKLKTPRKTVIQHVQSVYSLNRENSLAQMT